ncbi:MAG: DNA mismatch repair endonuclease MutL, partial [Bacteroidota bacterium]
MKQVIQLLPDHIANQIAAGEVVQRPASVVKELLENAVDAGATEIQLLIKDAGKALIQVIDNGCGMSVQDARMAFERHATSKIRSADDLFNIRTMGFRGEAMASIAAVAQVSLRTRIAQAELGTELQIEGSEIKKQEAVMTAEGSSVAVKNLFFNVPARRNFLKSNPVETRHILNEFTRVALAQPGIGLRMEHNGTEVYRLEAGTLEQRIVDLFGKSFDGKLIPIGEETPYVRISGFVGMPDVARKKRGEQFFFVNERFIKSGYLHHSVNGCYDGLLALETHPFYCIFFDIDPKHVDINIHPTKTEIKFDDERTVYSLLHSVVRK